MKKKVWFGTENDMRWISAPLANYTSTSVRWRNVDQFLNGGAAIRQSVAAHQEVSLSWAVQSSESLAPVVTLLHSPGPFYFVDPIAAQSNIVPSYWSIPATWLSDGPPLISDVEPEPVDVTSVNQYPARSIKLNLDDSKISNLRIPVPEHHTLHIGVHGSGGSYNLLETDNLQYVTRMDYVDGFVEFVPGDLTLNAQMEVVSEDEVYYVPQGNPTTRNAGLIMEGEELYIIPLPANVTNTVSAIPESSSTRTNMTYSGPGFATLQFTEPGEYTLSGIMAQILPNGETPEPGGFLPGRGVTGIELSSDPSITSYSVGIPGAQVGIAADFTEVGAWQV